MKVFHALLAGIAGALAMSGAMFLLRQAGINVSLEALLGSMITTSLPPWTTGFLIHLTIGAVMAFLYGIAFEIVQKSGVVMGGGLGVAHGLMAGLFMSGLPAMNPIAPDGSAPGPFLSHIFLGPLIFLLLHLLYGAVVGLVYGAPVHKPHLLPRHP
jgi:hypothetical protein